MGRLTIGFLYSNEDDLNRALGMIQKRYEALVEGAPYKFTFTDYYEKEMGKNLSRKFVVFSNEVKEEELAGIKAFTNLIEDGLRKDGGRTVNIDPGILSKDGLVLASNKEKHFKKKIGNGVFAHKVYSFTNAGVETFYHTFPDFRQKDLIEWFFRLR